MVIVPQTLLLQLLLQTAVPKAVRMVSKVEETELMVAMPQQLGLLE